jgi:hypothetical protein
VRELLAGEAAEPGVIGSASMRIGRASRSREGGRDAIARPSARAPGPPARPESGCRRLFVCNRGCQVKPAVS